VKNTDADEEEPLDCVGYHNACVVIAAMFGA